MNDLRAGSSDADGLVVQCKCRSGELGELLSLGKIEQYLDQLFASSEIDGLNWKTKLASWLVAEVVDPEYRETAWPFLPGDVSPETIGLRSLLVARLNVILTQLAGPVAIACELAQARGVTTRTHWDDGTNVDAIEDAILGEDVLRASRSGVAQAVHTIEAVLHELSTILISATCARNEYDYEGVLTSVDRCDEMPFEFSTANFTVFRCFKMVARAGLSRTRDHRFLRESVPISDWKDLSNAIAHDSRALHSDAERMLDGCMAYPGLILVSSLGHMRRQHAAGLVPELVQFVLQELHGLEQCCRGDRAPEIMMASIHHIHYYRCFALHVLAISISNMYPERIMQGEFTYRFDDIEYDFDDIVQHIDPNRWYESVEGSYTHAVVSIERALSLVPASSGARRDYYELTGENLEHEMSLRLEMLQQRINNESTVRDLAKSHVDKEVRAARDELDKQLEAETDKLHDELRSVSMRVIEIIGVFLAIVAFVGTSVVSATAASFVVWERIAILIVGAVVALSFFWLLRLIVLQPKKK